MKTATVDLSDFTVTINELRLKDIRKAISNIQEIFGDKDLDVQQFIDEKFDIIMDICSGFLTLSDDHTLDELTFSDIEAITPKFKEVNEGFLDALTKMGVDMNILAAPKVA